MADVDSTPLWALTHSISVFADCIDKGLDVSTGEVRRHALDGSLVHWIVEAALDGELGTRLGYLTRPDAMDARADIHMLAEDLVLNGWGRRGYKNSGMALLIAIFVEAIQQKCPPLAPIS